MSFKKILLPFDGSAHSINASTYALDLAKQYGAKVTIVHCYEWHLNMPEVPETLISDVKANLKREAENVVKKAQGLFEQQGVEHHTEIIAGSPGYVLAKLAKSKEYDLIILGSHGHSDIAGLFLGSVTHKVLNTIYCPVMVVP